MESSFASRDNQDSASADLKIQDGALEAGITNWTPRDQNGAPIHVRRNIGRLAMVCLSFNICNSWTAIASTLAIAISAGGTFTVIYGIIIVSVVYAAMAISLAELASIYPTAGGQYHFTSIIAPKRLSRILSYCCGAAAAYSWVFLSAAVTILAAQVLLAFPEYYVEGYEPQAWQYFLVFQAVNVVIMMYNIFLLKRASWTHEIGCRYTTLLACVSLLILLITVALTLLTFIVVCITCLARSTKQSSTFVWNNFQNNTGWPAGVTFLTGLVTPAAMYLGLDGALHLADECIHPETAVPRALLSTTAIGFCTGLVFSIAMCYSITDLDSLFNTT
jgi:choline transport protein